MLDFSGSIKRGSRVKASTLRGVTLAAFVGGVFLAAQSVCFAANPQTWIELRSPKLIVVTNADHKQARQVADQFEMIRAVFRGVFQKMCPPQTSPSRSSPPRTRVRSSRCLPESWTKKGSAHPDRYLPNGSAMSYIALRLDVSLTRRRTNLSSLSITNMCTTSRGE